MQEQQAAYVSRRAADTADLVRREEAAAAFEAGQAQVHGGRQLWGRHPSEWTSPATLQTARALLLLAGGAAPMSHVCGWKFRV